MKTLYTLFLLICISSTAFAQSAKEIVTKMDAYMRGESGYSELEMTIVRPRYERTIGMKSWSLGQDYSLIFITAPARDKGSGYLKRDKEIWNWIPNIERMIKLPPSMMSQSWMGSDFSNDDLVRESSVIEDYDHTLIGTETINGFEAYRIEMVPKPDAAVVYEKVLVWIEKNKYFQLKVENYDEYGELVNSINYSDVKVLGGREIPTHMELIPTDKPGNKTIIVYKEMRFNEKIEKSFFSIQQLKRMR